MQRLWRLPRDHAAAGGAATAESDFESGDAFVRRYSRETRPWIGFHADRAAYTVNMALSSDARHEGGRLVGLVGGRLEVIERSEGEATVHASDLLHAVTCMDAGVRYSLIVFFGQERRDVFTAERALPDPRTASESVS